MLFYFLFRLLLFSFPSLSFVELAVVVGKFREGVAVRKRPLSRPFEKADVEVEQKPQNHRFRSSGDGRDSLAFELSLVAFSLVAFGLPLLDAPLLFRDRRPKAELRPKVRLVRLLLLQSSPNPRDLNGKGTKKKE